MIIFSFFKIMNDKMRKLGDLICANTEGKYKL